jgi:ribokinase
MDLVASATRLPRPGESLVGSTFAMHPGGKAGNQAVSAARQGARTAIVARLGDDSFGWELRERLAAAAVDVSLVEMNSEAATGASPILTEEGGDYVSIIIPGASLGLTPGRLAGAGEVLESCAVLMLQLEIAPETSLAAAEIVRRAGGIVMLNAAPVPDSTDARFDSLLAGTDLLVVNRVEATAWSGIDVDNSENAQRAGLVLVERFGLRAAVVTLEARGLVLIQGDGVSRLPGYQVGVIDTVGAGDALAGAIAAALARGESLARAAAIGNAAGALAVQRRGGYEAAPTLAETLAFLTAQAR